MKETINFLSAPCEIAVRKYVPSIRASIAIVLVRDYGLSIYRAAKLLKLTPAAVSNYLLKRRGGDYIDTVLNDAELYGMVSKMAEQIISGNIDEKRIPLYICDICRKLRLKVEPKPVVPETPC
ncbi:transcriptional regulator [Pyrodictium delaneyi]|uniref:Transcriptional regulator n=1 Tax=Pyrodictium delaneyi TaxID=1273541 RepID=A0A211YPZ5_9CREN|nr:hypothetical protein [Pyrodictium delaneyi]OWJ55069.1 hypothetical protein Pdsh_05120 [Pyrodictium delaneyi]